MSKYLMAAIMAVMACGGWYLWHKEDADFFEAWVGSMVFFGLIFCAMGVLAFAPNYLPFG